MGGISAIRFFVALSLAISWIGCEKNIHIQVASPAQQLVVEGYIESYQSPVVILTRSFSYFSRLDTGLISSLFVHQARVWVMDEQLHDSVMLQENARDTTGGILFYAYRIPAGSHFVGLPGHAYDLHIQVGGQQYVARTTIPASGIELDSLYYMLVKPTREQPDTDRVVLFGRFYDPPQLGNYARYFTRVNHEPFYPGYHSVADDEVVNGTVFDFQLDRGVNKNQPIDPSTYGTFRLGDTITVKFCDIDKATYDFWRTWEYAFSTNGNPFSVPIQILGNIPGALGYWGGYRVMYKSIYIPR
ncbi:MAG: DUF4249 domain-containing protein [Thermoflavifilum sp.]|nr:DUF4249 domain-containing protein [Thermoflavifilum sp.]